MVDFRMPGQKYSKIWAKELGIWGQAEKKQQVKLSSNKKVENH